MTEVELENILDNFKIDILSTLSSQLGTLQAKINNEELALDIFCSKCQKNHLLREFPLNNVEVCGICEQNHSTQECPSFP